MLTSHLASAIKREKIEKAKGLISNCGSTAVLNRLVRISLINKRTFGASDVRLCSISSGNVRKIG